MATSFMDAGYVFTKTDQARGHDLALTDRDLIVVILIVHEVETLIAGKSLEVLGIDMIGHFQVIDKDLNPATIRTGAPKKILMTHGLEVHHAVPGQTVPMQDPILISATSALWMLVPVPRAAMVGRIA